MSNTPPIDPHTPVMKQPFSPATSRNVAAPASTVSHHLEVYYEVHEMQAADAAGRIKSSRLGGG